MTIVAQIVQHLKPGGIETMALDLSAFGEDHEKSIIISLEGKKKDAIKNWPRLQKVADNIIFLDKKPGLAPSLVIRLYRILKQLNVDVIHTHHIGPLLYAGIAARLARIKCLIHTEHDAWHLNDKHRRNLQRLVILFTQPVLVADAEIVASKMREFLKVRKIKIINNGIDTQRFTPGDKYRARQYLHLPQDIKIIGCSGRLEKVKGHTTLIYALTQLPETVHIALAGIGSTEKELRKLVNTLNINHRIHFLGRIDNMPEFYRALDIFCLPSFNEGYPISPLEAQACNIHSLVTDVGGSSETLCPITGRLTPAKDSDAMALTLSKMLSQKLEDKYVNSRFFVQINGDVRNMVKAYANLRSNGV